MRHNPLCVIIPQTSIRLTIPVAFIFDISPLIISGFLPAVPLYYLRDMGYYSFFGDLSDFLFEKEQRL